MVREYKDVDFMEFLELNSGTVTSGVAANVSLDLPVVPDERIALLIHKLDFQVTEMTPAVSVSALLRAGLNLAEGAFLAENSLCLAEYLEQVTAIDATARAGAHRQSGNQHYFNPPILIARSSLWLYVWSDGSHESTFEVNVKIGYTLARVPLDRMLRALVE